MKDRNRKSTIERLRDSLSELHRSDISAAKSQTEKAGSKDSMLEAFAHFLRFRQLGRAAIGAYLGFVVLLIFSFVFGNHIMSNLGVILLFLTFLSLLVYATLIQSGFYGALGMGKSGGNPLRIFFMGMPLYILIFLGEEKQMLRELNRRIQDSLPNSL